MQDVSRSSIAINPATKVTLEVSSTPLEKHGPAGTCLLMLVIGCTLFVATLVSLVLSILSVILTLIALVLLRICLLPKSTLALDMAGDHVVYSWATAFAGQRSLVIPFHAIKHVICKLDKAEDYPLEYVDHYCLELELGPNSRDTYIPALEKVEKTHLASLRALMWKIKKQIGIDAVDDTDAK